MLSHVVLNQCECRVVYSGYLKFCIRMVMEATRYVTTCCSFMVPLSTCLLRLPSVFPAGILLYLEYSQLEVVCSSEQVPQMMGTISLLSFQWHGPVL